ncbi:MAG: hypothetical protein QM733_21555 [Ilumatobacteraceae bacterium]
MRVGFDASADQPFTGDLDRYLDVVGAVIGTDDRMIAASYGFQTVTSRIAGVTVAGALALGISPAVTFGRLRWRELPDGYGVAVGVTPDDLVPTTPAQAITRYAEAVAAWSTAMRATTRIAERLLWGDAAASLAGVLRRCTWAGLVPAERATVLLAQFQASAPSPALVEPVTIDGHPTFRRATCCLLTKAGGLGMCEECSLLSAERFADGQRRVRAAFERHAKV